MTAWRAGFERALAENDLETEPDFLEHPYGHEAQVSRKSHSDPRTHLSAESFPLSIPHSKSV